MRRGQSQFDLVAKNAAAIFMSSLFYMKLNASEAARILFAIVDLHDSIVMSRCPGPSFQVLRFPA
jgi:hypothetical protein